MEDVLGIYHLPYDPKCPVVCFDETNKQLIVEKRLSLPANVSRCQQNLDSLLGMIMNINAMVSAISFSSLHPYLVGGISR
jgi:hypothetical protein